MGMMMAVSFARHGRLHYLDPGPYAPEVGQAVLVPTDWGPEVAHCVWGPEWVSDEIAELPVCVGLATDADVTRDEAQRGRRDTARIAAKRLVRAHDLPMKVTGVDLLDPDDRGGRTFLVYFTAPHRVDFRALVRDLARELDARIELRQLSPRDDAKVQGGIGSCGRDLCCATFLRDFEPVSIRFARDQDLGVNPMRIAGACGRLMCCLRYEHPLYADFRANAPAVGERVDTPEGEGTVVAHQVPKDAVVVRLGTDGRLTECGRASVCASRKAYESRERKPRHRRSRASGTSADGTTSDPTTAPTTGPAETGADREGTR